MAKKVFLVFCGVVLGTVLGLGQEGVESSTVVFSIHNEAGVPANDLDKAEQFATQVYEKAGVSVRWLNRPAGSSKEDGCGDLSEQVVCVIVSIVPKSSGSGADVLGVAFSVREGMGKFATVFYGRVRDLGGQRLSSAGVLGFVIAHEAGHILLGANSHSSLGIMQPCWESPQLRKASMGNLLFTPEQAERMQQRIRETERKKLEMTMRAKAELR